MVSNIISKEIKLPAILRTKLSKTKAFHDNVLHRGGMSKPSVKKTSLWLWFCNHGLVAGSKEQGIGRVGRLKVKAW